jgi:hypothetical protein
VYYNRIYDLNFGALGTFSPLNILSAPTFFPLLGQPYFGPNKLLKNPHELVLKVMKAKQKKTIMGLAVFMGTK